MLVWMFGLGRDRQQPRRRPEIHQPNKRVQDVAEITKLYDMLENFPAGA
jgi:hypothetical protein